MTEPVPGTARPGVMVGPTSEFSLFFRVKPGEGAALRVQRVSGARRCASGGNKRVMEAKQLRHLVTTAAMTTTERTD